MKEFDWQRVQDIFAAAITLRGEEQRDYLSSIQAADRELYGEVVSLISADNLKEVLPNSTADFDNLTKNDSQAANTVEFDETENLSLVGEVINDRYEIIKRLGDSGMGEIYMTRDRNVMNRETVVKLLKAEILANREVVRKFKQEIEALARVRDPGIVMILDAGTYGRQPFLVLEYVEGDDLAGIISDIIFSARDFTAPRRLAEKLARRGTPAAEFLWEKLNPEAKSILQTEKNEYRLAAGLRQAFNALLENPQLYDPQIFGAAASQFPTRRDSLEDNPADDLKFNRFLLESAFPEEIIPGKDKKLTAAEAALIFRQLGESLTHGHQRGIIHRDLKPANIMIARNERGELQTRLIDFGVAKVRESLVAPTTEFGVMFGTRKYMSPEQVNGNMAITPATDIYALGLIAFESLTGRHVFRTDSFVEQCRMQEREEFSEITALRPDLLPKVREIICRALSYKPENRQASAEEFGNSLADALLTKNIPPAKTEPFRPARVNDIKVNNLPAGKSGKSIAVISGALAIVMLLAFGGWLIRRTVSNKPVVTATDNAPPVETKINRELNYQLIVQKYYEGKPFQPPFKATGDEIFGDGWRFKMSLGSPQNGNLYLLSENSNTKNLTMLFPHPQQNGGDSFVPANAPIQTGEMAFDRNQGTEKFWIVWSEKPVAELEAVKSYVNPKDLGAIKDADREKAVRTFLETTTGKDKLIEKLSDDKQLKTVQTPDNILIKMAEFRHN